MKPVEIARMRLLAQRISATAFRRPDEVVAWLGAVQAQDYLGALWAVGLRLDGAREADVERALAERTIVRTWPLRGTLHFVAAADARWMIELQASRTVPAAAARFRAVGLDRAALERARRVVSKVLQGRRLTRPALYRELARAKVSAEGSRGLYILWWLAHACVICFGPREGKQQTFALFDEWVPQTPRRSREEALAELARRYFTSHGPATLHDFAWWAGLKLADARLAVHLSDDALQEDHLEGRSLWFARDALPVKAARARMHLLPAFDEYLVGYADRSAVIDPSYLRRLNDGGGILKPTLVHDGNVIGTWKRRLERRGLVFDPALFEPLDRSQSQALERALQRYARFLPAKVIEGRRG